TYRRMIYFRNPNTKLLGLLNIKYIVSLSEIVSPDLTLVLKEGKTNVYQNNALNGRAWTVDGMIYEPDPVKAIKLLSSDNFDWTKAAITEDPRISELELSSEPVAIENFSQDSNEIKFNTTGSGGKLIVVSEQFYPQWKLYIDGKQEKALRLDYN